MATEPGVWANSAQIEIVFFERLGLLGSKYRSESTVEPGATSPMNSAPRNNHDSAGLHGPVGRRPKDSSGEAEKSGESEDQGGLRTYKGVGEMKEMNELNYW